MAADERTRIPRGPVAPRIQLGTLLTPMEIAAAIENFRPTREGSLRSVIGPTPYLPKYRNQDFTWDTINKKHIADYTTMHGIFHAMLQGGQRDVLLLHVGKELWVFQGWEKCWRPLISATNTYAQIRVALQSDDRARAPTQFVSTPNGVIIIPQSDKDSRPYFYDGEVILPLGYVETPGAPTPRAPRNPSNLKTIIRNNEYGYDLIYRRMNRSRMRCDYEHGKFGPARIGSISTVPDAIDKEVEDESGETSTRRVGAPFLLNGAWSCATQWVDYFGNLSPISARSGEARLSRKPVSTTEGGNPEPGETLLAQFLWTTIDQGPKGTIGRVLYRTKDTLNSGTNKLYQLPATSVGRSTNRSVELATSSQFATVPENCSRIFPDNIPDTALVQEARDVVPMPRFKTATLALGRLFVANMPSDPGAVMYSLPGRWGTFERQAVLFPDPSGGRITGLWKISGGVLAFTESSTYLVSPSDDGLGFRSFPISTTIGCAAPRSINELPNGMVIWLTENGFYGYDGKEVVALFNGLESEIPLFTRSRLLQATSAIDYDSQEYLCWVTTQDGIYNNRGYVFDGQGWKIRTGAKYADLCTTRDHRKYVIGCGRVHGDYATTGGSTADPIDPFGSGGGNSSDSDSPFDKDDQNGGNETTTTSDDDGTDLVVSQPSDEDNAYWGVWVLNHESRNFYPNPRFKLPVLETSWIGAGEYERKTALTATVWFRETSATQTINVRVYRDWRKDSEVHTFKLDLDSPEDPSPAWSQVNNEDGETWKKRRPYWIRRDIYIPSCEVFKLRFEGVPHSETVDTHYEFSGGTGKLVERTWESVPDVEIVAIRIEESPRAGGARTPRSN